MKRSRNWMWPSYFFFYSLLTVSAAFDFFTPGSLIHTYYQIGTAYHIYFYVPYLLNALYLIIEISSLVPLFLYATYHEWLSFSFWRGILILRILLHFIGRSYEFNFLKSIWHDQPQYAYIIIFLSALIVLPSLIAHWRYAFNYRRKK
ncbi:MAG: hypothetical protein NUV91_04575 [Candidatus Omnitrophica bacterium]|nr:hypothetical protein [Candidatus Omnitrophota bacterium]